jgi:hypothetical protein
MAELLQLDAAAKKVGKSEVTIRRLVKAGKVPAHKEKTLTGFIYRVDPDDVRAYYSKRGALGLGGEPEPRAEVEPEEAPAPKEQPKPQPKAEPAREEVPHTVTSNGKVRVAVSDAGGDPVSYWLRRAETYEERYHKELEKSSNLREELGLWRGRAENAQAMLVKLLPAPSSVEVSSTRQAPQQPPAPATTKVRKLTFAGVIVVISLPLLLLVGAALVYLTLTTP